MKATMQKSKAGAKAREAVMEPIMMGMEDLLCNLYLRWKDESQYEDFYHYKRALVTKLKELSPSTVVVNVTKRPFGITIRPESFPYNARITAKGTSYGWEAVKT